MIIRFLLFHSLVCYFDIKCWAAYPIYLICKFCGAGYPIEKFADLMNDSFEEQVANILCDRL